MKKVPCCILSILSFIAMIFLLMTDKISRTLIWVGQINTGSSPVVPEPMSHQIQIIAIILFAIFVISFTAFVKAE